MIFDDLVMTIKASDATLVADEAAAEQLVRAEAEARTEASEAFKTMSEEKRYEFVKNALNSVHCLIFANAEKNERVFSYTMETGDKVSADAIFSVLSDAGYGVSYTRYPNVTFFRITFP